MTDYELEKWVWTEKDFDRMGWHDATIYGVKLNQNLELDIDYIFQWNQPEIAGFYFTFWVAPSTLVFENPTELSFELTRSMDDKWMEIEDVEMALINNKHNWTIITRQGDISFQSEAFKQIIRKRPSFQLQQTVPYDERGGFSFGLESGENIKHELGSHILERRKKQLEDYESAKRKFLVKKELETLDEKRYAGQINLKDFLIEKKALKEKLDSLTFYLLGSRYENL